MELPDLMVVRDRAVDMAKSYPERTRNFMEHLLIMDGMIGAIDESWAHRNYHDIVFNLAGTPRFAPLVLPEGYDTMEQGQCYYNAWQLVMENPSLIYCEGFALATFMPVEHAWVETPEGEIIDPTWTGLLDESPEEALYLGIRFSSTFAMRHAVRSRLASILQSDHTDLDYEILRNGLRMQDNIAIDIKERS